MLATWVVAMDEADRRLEVQGEEQGEAELVGRLTAYQRGEIEGFTALYAALAPELGRYFAGAAGSSAADDLVQETFLALHRARHTYQPPLPVRPWVFGIARNVLRHHRRTTARRSRREEAGAEHGARALRPPEPPAPSLAVEVRELGRALDRLPPERREAWLLHHVHGWSFGEIAARMRVGINAAKLRSSRAMRALRSALAPDPVTSATPADPIDPADPGGSRG